MDKLTVLKTYFGYDSFRAGQEKLINHILDGEDSLGVMPTGAGKSICFQLPALMFNGITLVISPLISLMKDQVNALTQAGIDAAYINSSLTFAQYNKVMYNARNHQYKILYIAPERLLTEDFISFAQSVKISMVTIDEAHCISQWGHDFRPSYLKIPEFLESLDTRPVVSAFTATATEQVRNDIIDRLRLPNPFTVITGFDRPNLRYVVKKPKDKFETLKRYLIDNESKTGIVYCSTRKMVEQVCERLNSLGISAKRYHAGLNNTERRNNQDDFLFDRCRVMVATNAFGMGIDKSNVSFVIHFNMPKNMESYYQEAGRAGRDGEPADCILLYSGQDVITNQWLIDHTGDKDDMDDNTNHAAKALEAIKEKDRELLKKMTFYCHTNDCLRKYILEYFGERAAGYCGNCSNCSGDFEEIDVTIEAQKILSCIKRAGERFGIKTIIDTLRGSKNEKILRLGLQHLSTYNIMKETSEKRLRDIINYLILNHYIVITNDKYPIAKCGSCAPDVLFNNKKISMKVLTEQEKEYEEFTRAKEKVVKAVHPELLNRLKNLRLNLAQKQSVPAFVVFSDATLVDMCRKLPANDTELLAVSGVGQKKLERYGQPFLKEIKEFVSQNPEVENDTVILSNISSEREFKELCNYINDEKSHIALSDEPVVISDIVSKINSVIAIKYINKISVVKVVNWLIEKGFICIEKDGEGNSRRLPTEAGQKLGICSVKKINKAGKAYTKNMYNKSAQVFLIDNIEEILKLTVKR